MNRKRNGLTIKRESVEFTGKERCWLLTNGFTRAYLGDTLNATCQVTENLISASTRPKNKSSQTENALLNKYKSDPRDQFNSLV